LQASMQGIYDYDFDAIRPQFRMLMRLVQTGSDDPLYTPRVGFVLDAILKSLQTNSRYWKITDYTLEHLIRMAKKSMAFYAALQANQPALDSILGWLTTYRDAPASYSREPQQVQLLKPTQNTSWAYQAHNNPAFSLPFGQTTVNKFALLTLVKEGKPLDNDQQTDSDIDFSDRTFKLHEWVDGQDTSNNWYPSQIIDVDSTGTRVRIHFDGWTSKWDEDFHSADTRLRPLGSYCTAEQLQNRGKPRKADAPKKDEATTTTTTATATAAPVTAAPAAQPFGPQPAPNH